MARNNADDRIRPKQARSKVMFEAIVSAGQELWLKDGPDTTTNAIAERAGVSVGSLYRYFPDKFAVFDAVAERYANSVWTHWEELAVEIDHLPIRRLPARMIALLAASEVDQQPGLAAAIFKLRASGVTLPSMDRLEANGEAVFVAALVRRVAPQRAATVEPMARLAVHSGIAVVKAAAANFHSRGKIGADAHEALHGIFGALAKTVFQVGGDTDESDH